MLHVSPDKKSDEYTTRVKLLSDQSTPPLKSVDSLTPTDSPKFNPTDHSGASGAPKEVTNKLYDSLALYKMILEQ